MFGNGPVQNPKRVSHPYPSGASFGGQDEDEQRLIDTLRRRRRDVNLVEKRVRGGWAKSRPRLLRVALKGVNPGEQPAVGLLNTSWLPGTLAGVKAQKPRLAEPARVLRHPESTAR